MRDDLSSLAILFPLVWSSEHYWLHLMISHEVAPKKIKDLVWPAAEDT